MAQKVKCLPAMQETWVRSLGQEDPLDKEMATHSSTLAWKIPWTEEPGRLQSMGSQRVGHDWATSLSLFTWKFPLPPTLFLCQFALLCVERKAPDLQPSFGHCLVAGAVESCLRWRPLAWHQSFPKVNLVFLSSEFPNKNTGCTVKLEFQVNNKYLYRINMSAVFQRIHFYLNIIPI